MTLEIISVCIAFVALGFAMWQARRNRRETLFINSVNNLTGNDSLKIEVAVHELLRLAKPSLCGCLNTEFNANIRLAFIKRLKKCPFEQGGKNPRLTYAQHIMNWLINNPKPGKNNSDDLSYLDLSYQDFVRKGEFIRILEEFSDVNKTWCGRDIGVPKCNYDEIENIIDRNGCFDIQNFVTGDVFRKIKCGACSEKILKIVMKNNSNGYSSPDA